MIGFGVTAGLVVGLFIGILTLLLGVWMVTLVAPSVQMWVDRSLVGFHTSQVEKFEDLVSEQSSLEMVFQGVVVELSWEPAKPNPVNYMGTGSHASGSLGVSSDEDTRQAEEERVKDLVVIEVVLKIPKQDVTDLTVQLVPKSQNAGTLFEWSYQKRRGSETLAVADGAGYAATQGNGSQPGFDLRDKVYVSNWSGVYRKEELGGSVDLVVRFRSSDTRTSKSDVLTLEIESSEVGEGALI